MPNGTLDGFNHVLDFDKGLTHVFRVSAIVFLRQSFRDAASIRNLSISCCDQLLNVLVILSHSGGLLLIPKPRARPRVSAKSMSNTKSLTEVGLDHGRWVCDREGLALHHAGLTSSIASR